ncbi:cytochrome-c peroxidase [Novosphingobium flavum]|uniref:cytochrome-c peroxidase n=1 Tax=Novosphingobium flavum TaxID=1778672 RepID=UPI0031B5D100
MAGLIWRLGALAAGAAALVGAAAPQAWRWDLPGGIAPPALPADNPMTAAKVELGRRLFYDADLSANGTMACATCHEQKHAFADGNRTHPGVTDEPGRRNVPGLANAAWLSPLTYADPAAKTLEQQAFTPVFGTHPVEMGMAGREGEIAARLGQDDCYRAQFRRAFPDSGGRIEFAAVAKALAAFERTLVSYGSAYDRGVMTAAARAGQQDFSRDCAACHAGARFTDLGFHRLGPADPAGGDQGAFENTGAEADRGKFRTPSLRNVALTGPWWHDGSAPSLRGAIARHGLALPDSEVERLLAFLNALSDAEFAGRKSLALPDRACGRRL